MALSLRDSIKAFLAKYGAEETSKITGKPLNIVSGWGSSKNPTLDDIELMIAKDGDVFAPAPNHVFEPYQFPAGKRVAILMPTNRPVHVGVLKSFAALYEREKMQFFDSNDTSIVRARNQCAQKFLDSNCEWSFWLDDDTVLPHGDVEYFRKISDNPHFSPAYININPIARLIQTGRTLVGGCYFGRNSSGVAQFQEAYQSNITNNAAHTGPRNVVDPVGWIGFGCTLVHRRVFEDIIATQPEVKIDNDGYVAKMRYRYRFFNYVTDEHSEDASFCIRAKKAGHQTYVDYAVMPIHMGEMGYSYHNTTGQKAFTPIY